MLYPPNVNKEVPRRGWLIKATVERILKNILFHGLNAWWEFYTGGGSQLCRESWTRSHGAHIYWNDPTLRWRSLGVHQGVHTCWNNTNKTLDREVWLMKTSQLSRINTRVGISLDLEENCSCQLRSRSTYFVGLFNPTPFLQLQSYS